MTLMASNERRDVVVDEAWSKAHSHGLLRIRSLLASFRLTNSRNTWIHRFEDFG